MKVVKLTMEWAFGILFGITGIFNIQLNYFLGGFLMIVSGFILIPPIFGIIQKKIETPILNRVKYFIAIALFYSGFFLASSQMMEETRREMERNESRNLKP